MKKLLLLLFIVLAAMPGLYAQDSGKKATVHFKHSSLRQAFVELEKQYGLNFSYNESNIGLYDKDINFSLKDATASQVLDKIFGGSPLTWTFKGGLVILTADPNYQKKPGASHATSEVLTGTITDGETAEPIQGVTVRAGDHTVLTGADGGYSLPLSSGSYTVTISHVGYAVRETHGVEISATAPTVINLALNKAGTDLGEVVVVGYGRQSRKALTSAISTVQNSEFNQGNFNNPAQLLQGKVAGLTISRSGDPNGEPTIILRGPSTLRPGAAQEPFYVIDEIPGADIRLVAPDDIATIEVLKDASATAIYGTRASNGVIMITTKKGRQAQTLVNYNSYVSAENVARKINMMNASQLKAYLAKNSLALDPSDVQGANTDWQKAVTQTAVSQNHHVALSGGSNNLTYNAAVNYFDSKGIMKNTGLNRLIGRAGIEQRVLNNHLRLGMFVSTSTSNSDLLPDQAIILFNMLRYLPTVPVKQADGTYTENLQRVQYYNPVSLQNNAWQNLKNKTTLLNGTAQVILPFGFKYDLNLTSQSGQDNSGTYYTSQYTLKTGVNGQAYRSSYESSKKMIETFLTFARRVGDHDINVLGGYSWQEDVTGDGFQASNQNFPTDALGYNNIGLGSPAGNYRNDWGSNLYQKLRLISFYTRAKYSFKDRYLLQLSLRRDASSAFGVNNRWATFPSASFAWRAIDESFLKSQTLFSDLKWRISYGITGNSLGFDPLISKVQYSTVGAFYYNGNFVNAIGPSQNANPDLKWEKTAMFNTGVDFALLKGSVKLSIEYYDKKTTDLIWYYPVSTIQYFVNVYTANVGSISNKGFELTIDATPVKTASFQWVTSLNLAHNKNKLVSLSNNVFKLDSIFEASPGGQGQTGSYVQILKSGKPVGEFFTFSYAGKNAAGVTQFYDATGKITLAPQNFVDYHYAGDAQPKVQIGWGNTFTYKSFDLNIFVRAALGSKVMDATLADLNRPDEVTNYNLPVFSTNESPKDISAYIYSNRYVENASYLRLDYVTLGYSFPSFFKGMRGLRIYVAGNNLVIITGYRGIDPEVSLSGLTPPAGLTPGVDNKDYYPRTRSFLLGLNLDF
ncbi:SusC/RagA family TonB-linked outer membrane protein [Puia dinghuensis]|uniref:SusC/RagA family TonB-linked outer membrane protein n=1 Tax=Puia dinghuensis TaxID=1792502 RepID=A0A8J2UE60_9BACT|nr:SusC/RagA family TonB-linked outer membrane protein [Puia dinghuensis]GGB03452.1 SusC/RagA family TonB-linked outer membrane protein [Puia dinghuensis]